LTVYDNMVKLRGVTDDANLGMVTKEPIQVRIGPVRSAQAKRIKESLNELIQSIWIEINSWKPKDDVPHGP
ncbi:hypothetical protein PanWU01x14_207310, partial [Parasponia andersonii]